LKKIFKFQPTLLPQGKLSDLYETPHGARVRSSCELADEQCLSYDSG